MINVSEQLKEESKKNHNYYVTANVTLADGTKLSLEKKDFYLDGNGIIDAADSSDFPLGVAIEKTATLSLVNDKGQFDKYSFNKAVFVIFMNLQLSDRLETFKRGSFIVCKKPAIDGEISLTLLDYMSKADLTYKTNLSFPCTAREVLEDACQQSGIVLGDAEFKNADFQVQKAPEGTTYRAVIGMTAALAGGNARIDENDLLRIVTFDKEDNVVLTEEIPWPDVSGQSILDTEEEEIITVYEKVVAGHDLTAVSDIENDIDPIVVTGVRYKDSDNEYLYGAEGYVIDVSDNQLLEGNAEDGVSRIGQIMEGLELLPFSLSSIPIGYAAFGDSVQFKDGRGSLHKSYITDIEFNFADGTEFACKAKSLESQGLEYPSGARAQVEQVLGKVEEKISAYDTKLKQMNDMAANTLGFYYTEIVQADGSVIAYRHNKLRLAESKIVYKTSSDGFFVTSDYQGTDEATSAAGKWTSGFDSNGDAVLNILYAIGIQAKWINTRGLTAKDNDGKVTFRINADTGDVEIDPETFILGKKTLQEKFGEIDESIASSRSMTMQLDNDYQSISVYNDGSIIGTFPTVTTTATVLYNSVDITKDCSFAITTSDSITGSWNNSTHTYTVKSLSAASGWVSIRATYLNTLTLTRKFTVAKLYAGQRGLQGLQGEDGTNGIPGKDGADGRDGVDGKTSYFHIKYSAVANPTSASQISETPDTYIGTYVDFTGKDSTDPKKYTWSKWEGKDGEKGIPGTNGIDGKTSYLHIAYANSADGKTGFSVSDSSDKLYIGQYTDYLEDDSTDPSKYQWSRMKGDDGKAGRVYFLDCPATIVKRMADGTMSPENLVFSGFYREGDSATRTSYKGRFKIEETADGKNWTTVYNSPVAGEASVTWSMLSSGSPKEISAVRCTLYALNGTTVIDYQTVEVVLDAEALTQEQILNILTNNGEWKGIYYQNGHLYFSYDAARGGTSLLGGKSNGNGVQKIYDANGNVIVTSDVNGITVYDSAGTPKSRMSNEGTVYFKEYYEDAKTLRYKGIVIGDMGGFDDSISSSDECGIKIINYERTGDVWDVNIDDYGLIYTADGLNACFNELEVNQITDVTEFLKPPKIFDCTHVSSGGHLVFANDGATLAYLSSSSKRYKDVCENLQSMEQWYNIQPVWAKYKDGYLAEDDVFNGKNMPMFLAEDVEKNMPEAAVYKDSKIEDWNYRVMIPAMFAMLKEQHQEIENLKSQLKGV